MRRNQFFNRKLNLKLNYFFGVFLLLSILGGFLISSCTEKEASYKEKPSTNDDITFREGRLIFKDVTSFMDHQKWLNENQGNPQLIADKNKSFGLKSMTEYYLEGMKLEENDPKFVDYVSKYPSVFNKEIYDNSTLYVLPHSIILCYIANEDGIFQVDDQIYRIVQNYIYRTGDKSKIDMLFLPKDQIPTKDVKISLSRPRLGTKSDLAQKTEDFNANYKFRIVSSVMEYAITDPLLGENWWYDIRTNPQKKTLFAWITAQLNTKSANGNGYWYFPDELIQHQIYPNYEETTGVTQYNVVVCGGSPVDLNASYFPAYSRGRLITKNIPEYIYIFWGDALSSPPTSCSITHTGVQNDPF